MNTKFSRLGRSFLLTSCLALGSQLGFAGGVVSTCTQQALEAAMAGGGTVTFACSGTLLLTNTIVISQNTTINGNGYPVVISGGNSVRLFSVNANVNARFDNLTLANGRIVGTNGINGFPPTSGESVFGAGILNLGGTLTLVNCELTNHALLGGVGGVFTMNGGVGTSGDASGAAIYSVDGTLNLTNCVLKGNSSTGGRAATKSPDPTGWAGHALGGAVYASGAGNFSEVIFSSNTATGGAPSSVLYIPGIAGRGAGGAIFATNCSLVFLQSSFVSNSAAGGNLTNWGLYVALNDASARGGAVCLCDSASATVDHSSFNGNSATGGNGARYYAAGPALGAAIYNEGVLTVAASSFSYNTCNAGGASLIPGTACGGAVYSTHCVTVNASTFNGNSVTAGNASFESVLSVTGATGAGGGVCSLGTLLTTNCTFYANSAQGGGGGGTWLGTNGLGTGGGLACLGGTSMVVNATFSLNQAIGGPANAVYPEGPALGGALLNTNGTFACANSILAYSPTGGNAWGTLTDGGYNISSDDTAAFSAPGSLNNTDPLLASLADNGGPTLTIALNSGSPAIDAIPAGYPPFDQRGVARPQGPAADIGAFEVSSSNPAVRLLTGFKAGNLTISFAAQADATYRLLASTNFVDWRSVATNQRPTAGVLEFVQPASGGSGFFRVVTP